MYIKAMLPAIINTLAVNLPKINIKIKAIMQIPVTRRNIRSLKLVLWSNSISSHFFNTSTPIRPFQWAILIQINIF